MKSKNFVKQQQNTLLAAGFTLLLFLLVSWRFDYFYALNDDMMIKDIVAGIFTGKPEGHNIQMLYPFSFLISLFYYVGEHIAWYGIFLLLSHFMCFYFIAKRTLEFTEKIAIKIVALLVEGILIVAFFLWELVFMHYTVTSGLLAATAAFLFYTNSSLGTWKEFIKRNIVSMVLVIVAYMIRTEMLLLVFPLIGTVGLFKWSEEPVIFTKENAKKYFGVLGIMIAGMLVAFGINKLAYNSEEWKQFDRFFDARTEVYDFYRVPSYEDNQVFYESVSLTKAEQQLLENYNFGLESKIDEVLMTQIKEYAKERWDQKHPVIDQLQESVWKYRNEEMTPRNPALYQLVILSYFVVLLVALSNRKLSYLWKIPFLFVIRSGLWLFIIYRSRTPDRITHPLCFMELLILMALLLVNSKKSKLSAICVAGAFVILSVFGIANTNTSYQQAKMDMLERETINAEYVTLQAYAKEHSDNFYLFDVMSTVPYSEKVFVDVDHEFSNIAYLGGWVSKSPLASQKLNKAGFSSEQEALLQGSNVYLLARAISDTSWIVPYFADQGITVEVTRKDTITQKGKDAFYIYQVSQTEGSRS